MKKALSCLLLAAVLAAPAAADPVPAVPVGAASGAETAVVDPCPVLNEDSRERPVRHEECILALPPELTGEAPAHQSHPLQAAEIALLQFFAWGVLVGGIARLAGRRFWIWFLVGLLLRQIFIAVQHVPFPG